MLIRLLKKNSVKFFLESNIIEIHKNGADILLEDESNLFKEFDHIITATGYMPKCDLVQKVKKSLENSKKKINFFAIGDCVDCKKIYNAINSGAQIAWQI
jgi:thioredoxin reductase